MFLDNVFFSTWPAIVLGALVFSAAFEIIWMLSDFVFDGSFSVSPSMWLIGLIAFGGYIVVGGIIRASTSRSGSSGSAGSD